MGNLLNASSIDLSNGNLCEIPEYVFKLRNLKKLNLSNNHITSLPLELGTLQSLRLLDLSNNKINTLKSKFFNLTSLETLILNNNQLKHIPRQIGKLANLKKLSLSGNLIESLPEEISQLKKVTYLNISNNKFAEFPASTLEMDMIQTLSIGKNNFKSIAATEILRAFPNLKKFYCFSPNLISNKFMEQSDYLLQNMRGNMIDRLKLLQNNTFNTYMENKQDKEKLKIFISYSHKDTKYKDEIDISLRGLNYAGLEFSYWVDNQIETGDKFKKLILDELNQADIAIIVMSRYFMASKFIQETELPIILRGANDRGVRIMTVIAGKCLFDATPLADYQTVNGPSTPLNGMTEHEQNVVYTKLCDDVRNYIGRSFSQP